MWQIAGYELQELKPLLPSILATSTMEPTFKEVWRGISHEDGSDKDIIGYLKKYLKGLSKAELKDFLRFCTGKYI